MLNSISKDGCHLKRRNLRSRDKLSPSCWQSSFYITDSSVKVIYSWQTFSFLLASVTVIYSWQTFSFLLASVKVIYSWQTSKSKNQFPPKLWVMIDCLVKVIRHPISFSGCYYYFCICLCLMRFGWDFYFYIFSKGNFQDIYHMTVI